MIIPDDLSLEELIGAMKAQFQTNLSTGDPASNEQMNLASHINMLETVKRAIDKKQDKQ